MRFRADIVLRVTLVLAWIAMGAGAAPATAPTAGGQFAAAIAHAQERSVKLYGAGIAQEHGYATGMIVSDDGLILTADGLVLATSNLRAVLPDGRMFQALVLRKDASLQAALLKVDARTPKYFEMPARNPVSRGDWVLALNNSFKVADGAEPLSVNMGIVSMITDIEAKRKRQDVPYDGDAIIIDAITSNPGAPGGPVMSADGKLAGMVGRIIESKSTNTRLNYAVPVERLRAFVLGEQPIAVPTTQRGKPYTGIALMLMAGRRMPAFIDRIAPDSPAAVAGLKKDDLVLAINGKAVRDRDDYLSLEASLAPGAEATFTVKRRDQVVQFKVSVREQAQHANP